jgi:flagellar biosynthesis/type III secretory pathway chaperone
MILVVNEVEYKLPESWDDITLKQFKEIRQIEYIKDDKLQYIIQLLIIVTELPAAILINLKGNQLEEIVKSLSFINIEELPSNITRTFTIGNDIYTLKEFNDLTLGETISLNVLSSDIENNISSILAILYQKNDEEFNSKTHASIAKDIEENISISQLWQAVVFFCNIVKTLEQRMLDYMAPKKVTMMTRLWHSITNGVTTRWRSGWLKGTRYVLTKRTK